MQLVSCQGGVLRTVSVRGLPGATDARPGRSFVTGLAALDALPPGGAFVRGAVHELLFAPGHPPPRTLALVLARAALASAEGSADGGAGAVVWSDPRGELYPPALAAGGLPLDRVFLLRPRSEADEAWAVAECLRSSGVAAVVADPPRLTRVGARRLQLAAEAGGGVGLLLRSTRSAQHYAAATRWLVAPAPGEAAVQRWRVELAHGHGGRVGAAVFLEVCRDASDASDTSTPAAPHYVRAVDAVADRPAPPRVARASA